MRLKLQSKITVHIQYNQKNCSVLKRKLHTLFSTIKRSHITLSNTVSLSPTCLWRENQPISVALFHRIRSTNGVSHYVKCSMNSAEAFRLHLVHSTICAEPKNRDVPLPALCTCTAKLPSSHTLLEDMCNYQVPVSYKPTGFAEMASFWVLFLLFWVRAHFSWLFCNTYMRNTIHFYMLSWKWSTMSRLHT